MPGLALSAVYIKTMVRKKFAWLGNKGGKFIDWKLQDDGSVWHRNDDIKKGEGVVCGVRGWLGEGIGKCGKRVGGAGRDVHCGACRRIGM